MGTVVDADKIGYFLLTGVECMMNKLMIQLCFVDFILMALVHLRFFNGYMAEDVVLSSLCDMQGYGQGVNRNFSEGVREAKEELERNGGLNTIQNKKD